MLSTYLLRCLGLAAGMVRGSGVQRRARSELQGVLFWDAGDIGFSLKRKIVFRHFAIDSLKKKSVFLGIDIVHTSV